MDALRVPLRVRSERPRRYPGQGTVITVPFGKERLLDTCAGDRSSVTESPAYYGEPLEAVY